MSRRIARSVRARSAVHARRYTSAPNRSQISMTRRSPARQPAMIAIRSLRFISGVRVLFMMTSRAARLSAPPS